MFRSNFAFAYSTKDRTDLTLQTLPSVDVDNRFDVLWFDGSSSQEGRKLPGQFEFKSSPLREVHFDVTGGPDVAIMTALHRMVDAGYDYCGLIENDILLGEGWFDAILAALKSAQRDGLPVGAVTARTIDSRVLFHRPEFAVMWNLGAGMALFTREAAEIILRDYATTASDWLSSRWKKGAGITLGDDIWELHMQQNRRGLGVDWTFAARLMEHGLSCIGTLPNVARNVDMDVESEYKTKYSAEVSEISEEKEEQYQSYKELLIQKKVNPHAKQLNRRYRMTEGGQRLLLER